MLKIGFGLGFLAKGLKKNHVDGIGVYSRELYQALTLEHINLMPYVFGPYDLPDIANPKILHPSFLRHVIESQFFRKKIVNSSPDFKPQLIHASDHLIPRVKNIPVVATVMDLIPFLYPEWTKGDLRPIKNHLFKNTIQSADHIITISQYSKNDLINVLNIPEEKISVTYLGVSPDFHFKIDEEDKKQSLSRLGLSKDFFLFIGTLQPRKNLESVLAAHALLKNEERKNHPLVIVGHAGWASSALLERIKKYQEQGFVHWLHYLPNDDLKCLLQSALALVYVSFYEGFGLPILEAFASGCPVLTSNLSSIPEVAGNAAILVDPHDVEAIQGSMKTFIHSPDTKERHSFLGFQQVKKFTWQRCAQETMMIYEKLC